MINLHVVGRDEQVGASEGGREGEVRSKKEEGRKEGVGEGEGKWK